MTPSSFPFPVFQLFHLPLSQMHLFQQRFFQLLRFLLKLFAPMVVIRHDFNLPHFKLLLPLMNFI